MNKSIFKAILLIMTVSSSSCSMRENPLLSPSDAPYGAVPFDKIINEDYENAIMAAIKTHDEEIESIVLSKETPSFENTIVALDRSGKQLSESILALSNLEVALGDTALMNIMTRITPYVSEHETNVLLNEALWERIKKVHDNYKDNSDLTSEDIRLIEETYREFAQNGANLEGINRDRYRELNSKLSDLTVKFSQNLTNEMASKKKRMWLKEEDLAGLPETIRNASREAAKEALAEEGKDDDGSFLITLFMPSYSPFMKYSERRDLRENLHKLYNSRNVGGEYDNTALLKEIANTRLEIAKLMGKDSFAAYRLQGTMAATPDAVLNLLRHLRDNYIEPMHAELNELEKFARESEGDDFRLMPWDYSFWYERLKNEKYAFNDEDMKPYFEINNTIDGVLGLATKLYGYTFKQNKAIPVYHPDVKSYEVYDKEGKLLGILYADFYYRAGKGPGAWMTEFRTETKDDNGKRELPLISIVMNFPKPVGDEPVLLTPGEVNTFLHEFGHALHGLSSQAKYASLSGTNVYRDFVELFSQFNENYLTQKEFLDGFARHYKTGEKMPDELIEKFIRAGQYGAAYACMRQLGFGFLDMAYYTITEPLDDDFNYEHFERTAIDPVKCFDAVEGCVFTPSFGHVFSGGYAAGYYGYKWSEVLDADAFSAFRETGIFNQDTAARFHKMLESGGTMDPMKLYMEFRGKAPEINALLERDGIVPVAF